MSANIPDGSPDVPNASALGTDLESTSPTAFTPTMSSPLRPALRLSISNNTPVEGPSTPPPHTGLSTHRVRFSTEINSRLALPNSTTNLVAPPATRSRGYSLRSSLFRRNVLATLPNDSRETELQNVTEGSESGSNAGARSSGSLDTPPRPSIASSRYQEADFEWDDPYAATTGRSRAATAFQKFARKSRDWPFARLARSQQRTVRQTYRKLKSAILKAQEIKPSADGRHIPLRLTSTESACPDNSRLEASLVDERTLKPYINNGIRTSRYSVWTFLPRQLLAQFCKVANFYFLCVSILQLIPGLSTTGRVTTIVPLMIFVSIAIGKEGIDDWRRARGDREENGREVVIGQRGLNGIYWRKTRWEDVAVGDVVRLARDEAVSADLVVLDVPESDSGVGYIETMALDGETNLKGRGADSNLRQAWERVVKGDPIDSTVVVEDPNQDLYKFEGRVEIKGSADAVTPSALTDSHVIYRGSIVRNTPSIIGLVVYTGEECKMRMNSNHHVRIKAPRLQADVNKVIVVIVLLVLLLSIGSTASHEIWQKSESGEAWYLDDASVGFGQNLASMFLMFNTLIPISLYVSLEIVKVAQVWLMENDRDMWAPFKQQAPGSVSDDQPLESRRKKSKGTVLVEGVGCEAHTSAINEELGQVGYVFSDKTGTLTENEMKVRKVSVGGVVWRLGHASEASKTPRRYSTAASGPIQETELESAQLLSYVGFRPGSAFASRVVWMLAGVSVCHAALPDSMDDTRLPEPPNGLSAGPSATSKATSSVSDLTSVPSNLPSSTAQPTPMFQSSSPDEVALVQAAYDAGFRLLRRDNNTIILQLPAYAAAILGEDCLPTTSPVIMTMPVLGVVPFSPARRRMSVIVRLPSGHITLFCKGADSVISTRLDPEMSSLARRCVIDIESRAKRWRDEEVFRESMSRPSVSRPSMSRPSFSNQHRLSSSRPSVTLPRHSLSSPLEQLFDEHDVHRERDPSFYVPRPSMQLDGQAELVEETMSSDSRLVLQRCLQHIYDFSSEGLRTLLYGHKTLSEDDFARWHSDYSAACVSLVDRETLMETVGARIETGLELSGGTAIEDRLQDGVPETIIRLRRAGIKVWMLTGDKRETAINIGHSCGLIRECSDVFVIGTNSEDQSLTAANEEELSQQISDALESFTSRLMAHVVVVIDGPTLSQVNASKHLRRQFFVLALRASAVVCCRASPAQKALLVHAIRKRTSAITLAIGDGANDIAMIQEAHVGIGIAGREGLQAARVSDYSIGQFRFLTKLLLVHGRWNYVRTCKYTLGTFSKEIVFYLTQATFQRFTGFSGTSLHEPWSLSMFNTLFTSLPVIFLGIFDQDIRAESLVSIPELYRYGIESRGFGFTVTACWIGMAAVQSIVIFFYPFGFVSGQVPMVRTDGSIFPFGVMVFTAAVILINVKLQFLATTRPTVTNALAIGISVTGWFVWNFLIGGLYKHGSKAYYVADEFVFHIGRSPIWWLGVIATTVLAMVVEIAARSLISSWKRLRGSEDAALIEMIERNSVLRRRIAWEARSVLLSTRGPWLGPEPDVNDLAGVDCENGDGRIAGKAKKIVTQKLGWISKQASPLYRPFARFIGKRKKHDQTQLDDEQMEDVGSEELTDQQISAILRRREQELNEHQEKADSPGAKAT